MEIDGYNVSISWIRKDDAMSFAFVFCEWTLRMWWSIRVVLINEDVVGFLNVVWESNDGDLVNTCKPCKNALAHVKKFIHEYFKGIIAWLLGY